MTTRTSWTLRLDGGVAPERDRVGGKAASLARMAALGLRVPPAFVVTTDACRAYFEGRGTLPPGILAEIREGVEWIEQSTDRRFGSGERPLLVAVRSGAAISMPGMMDTVLDLGMNEKTERGLAADSGDAAFAADTHRRFRELYSRIVDPIVPESPIEQLRRAVIAVFESSRSRRARAYRKNQGIADDLPTAVTVQAMVFGNFDARSGTGVLFTRNPLSGEPAPYGEYLMRAQGEDVVSGTTKPEPLARLRDVMPEIHDDLVTAAKALEHAERDVQDVEFTVERGRLYFLQSRVAKRSPEAAVRLAVDLAREGLIDPKEALRRVTAEQVATVLRPRLGSAARAAAELLARGEPASPGIATGVAVEDCDEAERRADRGEEVVLARPTTSPEDVHGMMAASAVVTEVGGSTSHAAVVGRQLGKPCVVGCGIGVVRALVGREITVDGETGEVFAGRLALEHPSERDHPYLSVLAGWAGDRPLHEVLGGADAAR